MVLLKAELLQKLCQIYGGVFSSILERGESRQCPHLQVSIRLTLDTLFKMSTLQWKISKIYKHVWFYDHPFSFYMCVCSGFSRKERWKRPGWSSWPWGEYCTIYGLKNKTVKRITNQTVGWCHCRLNLPGAAWFARTLGDEGLPRAGGAPRTNWVTRVARKIRTTGDQ